MLQWPCALRAFRVFIFLDVRTIKGVFLDREQNMYIIELFFRVHLQNE